MPVPATARVLHPQPIRERARTRERGPPPAGSAPISAWPDTPWWPITISTVENYDTA